MGDFDLLRTLYAALLAVYLMAIAWAAARG
jgi:hypothetical protein